VNATLPVEVVRVRSGPAPLDLPRYMSPGAAGLDLLPVVSRLNIHELVGVIYLNDILRAYGISVSK